MPLAVSCDRVRCLAKTRHLNPHCPRSEQEPAARPLYEQKEKSELPAGPFFHRCALSTIGPIQLLNAQLADLTTALGTSVSG